LSAVSGTARRIWLACGIVAMIVGTIGIALPLLPTVPFYILAAFCFGKGNPAWERRLLDHPRFGPHIVAWRERGAITRRAKWFAGATLGGSAAIGLATLRMPWAAVPLVVAAVTGSWLLTRPEA
jgi:uncharacterized membrane protein YbaN (DUF454 family)